MACYKLETCSFFNDKMPMDSGVGAIYKKKYCTDSNETCARYIVMEALGPEHVPVNLYPGMLDVAQKIISAASKTSTPD